MGCRTWSKAPGITQQQQGRAGGFMLASGFAVEDREWWEGVWPMSPQTPICLQEATDVFSQQIMQQRGKDCPGNHPAPREVRCKGSSHMTAAESHASDLCPLNAWTLWLQSPGFPQAAGKRKILFQRHLLSWEGNLSVGEEATGSWEAEVQIPAQPCPI